MSNIASITAISDSSPIATQGGLTQIAESFESLGKALQSGNAASANSALSVLQQALQDSAQSSLQTATSHPSGNSSQANADYRNLTHALRSGDLSTAQLAYASLQNDLKSAHATSSVQQFPQQPAPNPHATAATSTSLPAAITAVTNSATDAQGNLNVLA